jgi:transposase
MFINTMKMTQKDGTLRWKIQICESNRVGEKVVRKVIRHVGTAHHEVELERFQRLAAGMLESEIANKLNVQPLFDASEMVEKHYKPVERVFLSQNLIDEGQTSDGPIEIYGSIFDELNMDRILDGDQSEILKGIVVGRIVEPCSKRKTQEILSRDYGFKTSVDSIYRMMGALSKKTDTVAQRIFQSTCGLLENKIDVVFFDVTTLYFESVLDDDLRKFGFSKDQKSHSVQVVLALATTNEGLPIGYKLFPGNTAETKTLIRCLDEWKKQIQIGQVVFVADRGMFSSANLSALEEAGYQFIVAAKLRNMTKEKREQILSKEGYISGAIQGEKQPVFWKEIAHEIEHRYKSANEKWETSTIKGRLICSSSASRRKKDEHDRTKLLEKMKKILESENANKGESTKLVSNSGYKKFAKYEGKKLASIDQDKVVEDMRWDGIHGLFTNSERPVPEIIERYRGLWQIEETFRVCKSDLKMRPIFHFAVSKIEAHIAICFLSLTLVRNLQFKLRKAGYNYSPERIKSELLRVKTTHLFDQANGKRYALPSKMSEIAEDIYKTVGKKRKLTLKPK